VVPDTYLKCFHSSVCPNTEKGLHCTTQVAQNVRFRSYIHNTLQCLTEKHYNCRLLWKSTIIKKTTNTQTSGNAHIRQTLSSTPCPCLSRTRPGLCKTYQTLNVQFFSTNFVRHLRHSDTHFASYTGDKCINAHSSCKVPAILPFLRDLEYVDKFF
jgi:hypothetical protein